MTEPLYRIGEAARLLELETYVLRFWETEFAQLEPFRTPKGQRLYTATHLDLLRRVKTLLYDDGLTIEGARKVLARECGLTDADTPIVPEAPPAPPATPAPGITIVPGVPGASLVPSAPSAPVAHAVPAQEVSGTIKLRRHAKAGNLEQGPAFPRVSAIYDDASLQFLHELRAELVSLQAFVRDPSASSSPPVPSSDTNEEPSA